eukprot:2631354-Prymnesium_polylepis.1
MRGGETAEPDGGRARGLLGQGRPEERREAGGARGENGTDASDTMIEQESSQPASKIWHCCSRELLGEQQVCMNALLRRRRRRPGRVDRRREELIDARRCCCRDDRLRLLEYLRQPPHLGDAVTHLFHPQHCLRAENTLQGLSAVTQVSSSRPARSAASTTQLSTSLSASTRATANACRSLSTSPAAVRAW